MPERRREEPSTSTVSIPHEVVPECGEDQSPGQDGETQHQAGDDWEDHRDEEINEEGDEGPADEDRGHGGDDEHVGDQPGQEQLPSYRGDGAVEEG